MIPVAIIPLLYETPACRPGREDRWPKHLPFKFWSCILNLLF